MSAALIDWTVVIAYFAATIWLGNRLGRGQQNLEDYFLAGRRTPWLGAAVTLGIGWIRSAPASGDRSESGTPVLSNPR
jgi:Na+/proline symporter